ncbi:MAG: dicarboxylate/amino acid:cation symporter [Planctomycetota bacterium]
MSAGKTTSRGWPLWVQVLIAMVAGIGTGLLLSPEGAGLLSETFVEPVAAWIALPGRIFLALVQMIVVALVMSSIMLGVAEGGGKTLKRIGPRIFVYFLCTTVVAVTIGVLLASLIRPGDYVDSSTLPPVVERSTAADAIGEESVPDKIVRLVPTNLIQAQLQRDMLLIVIAAIFMGLALVSIAPELATPVLDVARGVQAAAMRIVDWAMRLAPIAVFGLLCDITIRAGPDAIVGASVYIGVVLAGLFLLLLFYVVVAAVIGRKRPRELLGAAREVQLMAFSTSSSAAVIPLSLKAAEKLGVRRSIARFVVPLGATVNMDGTALYQVVATIFLAQAFGIELTAAGLVAVAATTIGASIGTPSTPGVGIVVLGTVLEGVGVPLVGIALVLGVDRILDMCRTAVNVTGDLTACVVMDRWAGPITAPHPLDTGAHETHEVVEPPDSAA